MHTAAQLLTWTRVLPVGVELASFSSRNPSNGPAFPDTFLLHHLLPKSRKLSVQFIRLYSNPLQTVIVVQSVGWCLATGLFKR